ncbi:desmosome associated protein-like protein pinnin isoform X1 [Megachile rotundata]|uniref:desmosome associated protein-like protein pinnin isoform X1 n=1 Tax=Megachile rotundata TaxID=143995 RepID=UPI000614A640|nr:PREDICTED: pinin isoform X1 [Megachile rotundata]XP_012149099.1 PREDICTED: pinin isoform X1 [Megachile rotundata]
MRKLDVQEAWGAERLEAQLEAARDGLRGLDRSIRKILGRDLPDGENGPIQPPPRLNTHRLSQKRPLQEDRRRVVSDFVNNELPGGKRRWQGSNGEPKTVFSRLSARVPSNNDDSADEDDNVIKPAVSSRVIATPREIPSRQEVIRRERIDERSRQRNKRMFGALLGTLQKFRQEETKLKAKEDKKAEVEARVEEARRREKEELRRERQQLFLSRKRQLAEVRALEAKLARSRQFQDWRAAQLPLASFIKTRAQPAIYYVPKRKHPQTDILLAQSAKELHEEIERREKALVEELELIEVQVGLGKHQQSFDGSATINTTTEVQQSTEEGEENRDPNPEQTVELENNEEPAPPVKFEKNENCDNSNDIEVKEEVQVDEAKDENNG